MKGSDRSGDVRSWSEGWMQVFLETAVDAIIVIDSRGLVESFNPAAERMFGYREEDVVGMNVSRLMPQPYEAEHDGYLASFLSTGRKKIIGIGREVAARRRDGSVFPIHLSVTELELNGETRFTGIIRDLTGDRQLQRELLHAQKLEAVGRLAGALAHDFNNLLMGVISGCSMASRMVEHDEAAKELLAEIQATARNGAGITRQLLDFSRKRHYETTPCDLCAIVESTEGLFRKLLGEDVDLRASLDRSAGTVLADSAKIEQILMNLVVNARDAMPSGGRVLIEVSRTHVAATAAEPLPGPYVVLSVSDTGCGMDEDTQAKAFEPFYTTKPMGKGTGLGLSTVFGLTREFKGRVELDSAPGRGTTLRLCFPEMESHAPAPEGREAQAPGGTETILVVEDATLVRAGIRSLLLDLGYTVHDAPDAEAALEKLSEVPGVDLLLTDIVMPGMSGPELAERAKTTHPGIRVLFMSAFSDQALVEQGRLQSGQPVIEKPFEEEELAQRVRKLFSDS